MSERHDTDHRKRGRLWVQIGAGAVVVALILVAVFMLQSNTEPETLTGRGEGLVEAGQVDDCLMEGAVFLQTVHYERCGHDVVLREADTRAYIGMKREALQAKLSEWHIVGFTPLSVDMDMVLPIFCPDHVVLQLDENGTVFICRNDDGKSMRKVAALDLELDSMSDAAKQELSRGKAFASADEMEAYLENIQS